MHLSGLELLKTNVTLDTLKTSLLFTHAFFFFSAGGNLKPFGEPGNFIEGKKFEPSWVGLGEGKEREWREKTG